MTGITFTRHEGADAAAQLDAFLAAYEEVYAEPPYYEGPRDVAEFVDHYQVHTRRPAMRLVIAWDGDEAVGFTYGYFLLPETRWWHNLQDVTLSEEYMREDGHRSFAIIELAVRKAWRRRGVAAGLHAHLLDGLDAERVTLTVRPEPEADPARTAYLAWGYRKIGTSHPWEDAPLYDCMVQELPAS
ncbi:GNAT family N-acetyltransferase [Streptomyces argyrophylli]|uniref:GNAT family N-acetyltransferase n=1 Tax=Streptomyces argyrophylli TaxID=2726118 RepID=A0A6M4PLW3_9ACTN|nr:GNAT family N-acetyltransferase [Streptomyces argyrophyllae]QJS11547.1 GNAT family N-acetyltransferase [Streptomyces argyrophyllae]